MAEKTRLTKRTVDAAKPRAKEFVLWDTDITGFGLRTQPTGKKAYLLKYRTKADGTLIKLGIGTHGDITADQARKIAGEWHGEIANGGDPRARIKADTAGGVMFKAVAENFLKRYVEKNNLRSGAETKRALEVNVYPKWRDRSLHSIGRRDVSELLDAIEDNNGPVMADRTLACIRKLFNWHTTRDDNFTSPVVIGMARTKPRERARKRVLSDDVSRLIWPLLSGTYGALVKTLLLSGQRLGKVSTMRWQDINSGGLWTIPTEMREKNNPGTLPLSRMALDVIEAQPKIDKSDFVFAGRGGVAINGFPKAKLALDAKITEALRNDNLKTEPLEHWTLHDLRRSAKTMMARAGVRPDVSERVLGHVIPGAEGVYDRHSYNDEKADALNRLAGLVEKILRPPADNVTEMTGRNERAATNT